MAVTSIDKQDVLFVVDDAPSMAEEQQALARELPHLVERMLLVDGPDGPHTIPPGSSVHVGIVSADLGTSGVETATPGCTALGDDGLLRHMPSSGTCEPDYPAFLSYIGHHPLVPPPSSQVVTSFEADFGCIASLGTGGCGYGQPLEATLKALWPSSYDYPMRLKTIDFPRPAFLSTQSHGDRENAGFLRNDPVQGLSVIHIIIVTDEDDCSVADTSFFAQSADAAVVPQARCAAGQDALYPIERYRYFKALRRGNENLVTLDVIAGIPSDLVDRSPPAAAGASTAAGQSTLYERVLADPRMQNVARADGTLTAACESDVGRATPARRLVALAAQFPREDREEGNIHSICSSDWSTALGVSAAIWSSPRPWCLRRPLPRLDDDHVQCRVVWELLPKARARDGDLTSCDEIPSMLKLDTERPATSTGGQRCIVRQLRVTGVPAAPTIEPGDGWYYDDFSQGVARWCSGAPKQGIVFSADAKPTDGVTARIECAYTHVLVPTSGELARPDAPPLLFDACDPDAPDVCARRLRDPRGGPRGDGLDGTLECHPALHQCVLLCTDAGCPAGFHCNDAAPPWCQPSECRAQG